MTRKHFNALAEAIRNLPDYNETNLEPKLVSAADVILAIQNVCAQFNPNFNRPLFAKACWVAK